MRAMFWSVIGVLVFAGCQPANVREASSDAPTARTQSGVVVGERAKGVTVFRGIPYAAAPVGERRWTAPSSAPAWQGVRSAQTFGPACPQPKVPPPFGVDGPTSEDCLFLNVWTPAGPDAGELPVLVWIHGGAFLIGSGSQPIYDGSALARQGMVVVTLNYRMGALGFLNHHALQGQKDGSANFGLLDQLAALNWVQRNIAAFGGDPDNITVAGESAGGVSVQALMASPLGKGAFQHAIIQSGGGLSAMADARGAIALAAGEAWAGSVGAGPKATAADLRALPVEKIAQARFISFPSIDGKVLERNPAETFLRGEQADVPLLIGANSWEASLTILDDAYAQMLLGNAYDGLLQSYRDRGLDKTKARDQLRTDLFFVQPARYLAGLHARRHPTWLYHFEMVPASMRGKQPGAAHGGELAYLFATPGSVFTSWDGKDRAISEDVIGYWSRFVASGNPNLAGQPSWREADEGDFMAFRTPPQMTSPSAQDRHALEAIVKASQPLITNTGVPDPAAD